MIINTIRDLVSKEKVQIRHHARIRMRNRGIKLDAFMDALAYGEVIEEYPDDKPYPSCLIYGESDGRPIHVVCAISDVEIIVITAYEPDPEKWLDFKIRKK